MQQEAEKDGCVGVSAEGFKRIYSMKLKTVSGPPLFHFQQSILPDDTETDHPSWSHWHLCQNDRILSEYKRLPGGKSTFIPLRFRKSSAGRTCRQVRKRLHSFARDEETMQYKVHNITSIKPNMLNSLSYPTHEC